jgi:hypothetical protein
MDEIILIPVPGREGVIFPATHVPRFLTDGGAWTPSAEDVAAGEQRLQAYLTTLPASLRNGAAQRIAARLDWYARQYLGVSWRGRRYLHINCFPAGRRSDWQTRLVIMVDGGESYFHLLYDPESGEVSRLSINGVA